MPMWAIGLSAAAGAGGSIFSGLMGASGASKSAAAIRYAADKASETALTLNSRAWKDLQPFRDLGVQTSGMLSDLFSGESSIDDLFKAGSLYNFESETGTRTLNRPLASRGQYGSGAGLESLALFDESLVAEEGDKYFNKLFGTTQLGKAAAAQQASNTTSTGNSIADIQAKAGLSEGQAYQNQYNALGSAGEGAREAVGAGVNNWMQYSLYNPILQRMGGGGNGNGYVGSGRPTNGEMDMGVFNQARRQCA